MSKIFSIYGRALGFLKNKPFVLWGISLLEVLITSVVTVLFGIIPGVALAVNLLIDTSMVIIFLRSYRGQENHCVNLFDCFKDWKTIKRVLCGMLWMKLWIFLWSLIPIVGIIFAIIRTYEYRLTPYILVFEQDVPITEAIKVSKERTKGWKGSMFWADVLVVVCIVIASLILTVFSRIPYIGILFAIVDILFSIAVALFINLFVGIVHAAYYEEIMSAPVEADPFESAPVEEMPATAVAAEAAPVEAAPAVEAPVEAAPADETVSE